eukprot:6888912-Prymnesium_polylepis.2
MTRVCHVSAGRGRRASVPHIIPWPRLLSPARVQAHDAEREDSARRDCVVAEELRHEVLPEVNANHVAYVRLRACVRDDRDARG